MTPRTEDFLNLSGWRLDNYNLRFMLKISCACCFGLSPVISALLILNMRRSLKSQKNPLNPAIFGFQGRSRSSMLIFPKRQGRINLGGEGVGLRAPGPHQQGACHQFNSS